MENKITVTHHETNAMRHVDIPIVFKIDKNLLDNLSAILKAAHIENKKYVVIHGGALFKKIVQKVVGHLKSVKEFEITHNTIEEIKRLESEIQRENPDFVIGLGGGRILDPAKQAAAHAGVNFISIPTALSHDGIASPVAVIDFGNEVKSIYARMPYGVIVDIDVIKKSPVENIGAGIGDLLSNISAAEDWLLAEKHGKFKVDYFALFLARTPAMNLLHAEYNDLKDERLLHDLAEGLIMSGIAMGIAGNSRPASGAEHLISHGLDRILKNRGLHGTQSGIATIFAMGLRGSDMWKDIKDFYKKLGLPQRPEDIGITKEVFLEAVKIAPTTRANRFTILDIKGKDKRLLSDTYAQVYT
jgi:glycerol-1-phosphate dehydrogenase [NAD(P)+]